MNRMHKCWWWSTILVLPFVMALANMAHAMSLSSYSVILPVGNATSVKISDAKGSVTATSSNTKVATVTVSDGKLNVTGKAAGSVRLKVKDRRSKAYVNVSVTAAALSVSPQSVTLAPGQSAQVKIANARGTLSVSVSNSAVAAATISSGSTRSRPSLSAPPMSRSGTPMPR